MEKFKNFIRKKRIFKLFIEINYYKATGGVVKWQSQTLELEK